MTEPLLTLKVLEQFRVGKYAGESAIECSLDLQRSNTTVELKAASWI